MISVVPNAGMPAPVEGKTVYPLAPEPFADAMTRFVEEAGVNIGERCNASGSRKFKRLLEEEDLDGIMSLAKDRFEEGSHLYSGGTLSVTGQPLIPEPGTLPLLALGMLVAWRKQ